MKLVGAIDIGGTKTCVAVVQEDGVILARTQWPTSPELGFARAAKRMRNELGALSAGRSLDGIGISCPGPFEPRTRVLGEIGTLPGWRGCDPIGAMRAAFDLPVIMENDADAAAHAEATWGSGRDSERFMYITVSTGIGTGFLLSGKLYRGAAESHPEVGHILIDSAGPLCYCGLRGCWESLASGTALADWYQSEANLKEPMTAQQICEAAEGGDALALRALSREAHYLGRGLANLVTAFVPDTICLGGGLMASSHLFLPDAVATMRRTCTQVPNDVTDVALSQFGSDASLLGAASICFRRST